MIRVALVFTLPLALIGCATIVRGGTQRVIVRSNPSEADVKVIDELTGATVAAGRSPLQLSLEKGAGFFKGATYRVTMEKPGYAPREMTIQSSLGGWYLLGNLFFGGLIG